MIEHIDFDKLLPYKDDKKHSFEEMCYQLCLDEYGTEGTFTSIDDSGGGDGVEYYLTLPNGDIWGWQCKFFGRFNEGGRKEQIKKSLGRAYAIHGNNLKRWILCSKLSLTSEEREWFETQLKSSQKGGKPIIPVIAPTELIHWGDSEILSLLRKHISIYNFFFNDKIISFSWFAEKAAETFDKHNVKSKYDAELYCSMNRQQEIYNRIGGKKQADELNKRCLELNIEAFADEYDNAINELQNFIPEEKYKSLYDKYVPQIISMNTLVNDGNSIINQYIEILVNKDMYEQMAWISNITVYRNKFNSSNKILSDILNEIESSIIGWSYQESCKDKKEKESIEKHRNVLLNSYFILRNYGRVYLNILEDIEFITEHELHIAGKASQGKSNLALNVYEESIKNGNPALFLLGREFKNNSSLEDQILQLLDLRDGWNFEKFLQVLDVYGKLSNTKTLFIIDGLNENLHWKEIWSDNLDRLIAKFKRFKFILFITTYRASYEKEIFPQNYFTVDAQNYYKRIFVSGYDININEAIDKYSNYYEVIISRFSSAIKIFRNEPVCLRLFFEAHRRQTVELIHDSVIYAFEEYLSNCINNICNLLGTKFGKEYVKTLLNKLILYLWEHDSNGIPLKDLSDFKEPELEAFNHEDILLYRDFREVEEFCFTYDLIAGYLIASHLLDDIRTNDEMVTQADSDLFKRKLTEKGNPLFDVITNCYILLASRKFGISCCIYLPFPNEYIIDAIYGSSKDSIDKGFNVISPWIEEKFTNNPLSFFTKIIDVALEPDNKLNFIFSSHLLTKLTLPIKDLTWTEYIRSPYRNGKRIDQLIKGLENRSKTGGNKEKLYLGAHVVMWCLASVSHQQRYEASKALYWYGRTYPVEFLEVVRMGAGINDPYISERLYGVAYGIALAMQGLEKDNPLISDYLVPLARLVYEKFFFRDNITICHYLSRIYCRGIVDLASMYGTVFSTEENKCIFSPIPQFNKDDIEKWKEQDDSDIVIRMDFSNYQLGYLIPDGGGYSNPPLKKKSRWFLHQRIHELGWNEEQFGAIDNNISSDNWSRHNDNSKVDRYGKKYSWIAYYELAGILDDIGLLQNEWDEYRPIAADIDPSFPEEDQSIELLKDNFLGDNSINTKEWIETDTPIELDNLLYGKLQEKIDPTFICVYGYFCSQNQEIGRKRFTFVRPLIINAEDYEEFLALLSKQDLRGRWLPEIQTNSNIFAGEMHLSNVRCASNFVEMSFVTGYKPVDEKNDEEDSEFWSLLKEFGNYSGIRKQPITRDFKVFLPTMEYYYETDFSHETGRSISFEISSFEKLRPQAQSFEMLDANGKKASVNTVYSKDYNNQQHFVFLRKDILDHFLDNNNMKMVWAIWGEKDYTPPMAFKVFQQIEEYKE